MPLTFDLDVLDVPVFVVDVEADGSFRVFGLNAASEREFGFPQVRFVGKLFEECMSERISASLRARYQSCVRSARSVQFEEFADLPGRRWFRTTLSPCLDPASGRVVRIMAVSQDITATKRLQARLRDYAFTDSLTGLPNRRRFEEAMQDACDEAVYSRRGFSLCVVDIDELKLINDVHGHQIGDEVIRLAATVLAEFVEAHETVARVGGDEFYLLLDVQTREGLDARLDRIRSMVDAGLRVPSMPRPIHLSVGGAVWLPGDDVSATLSEADAAMYAEKGLHRLTRIAEIAVAQNRSDASGRPFYVYA